MEAIAPCVLYGFQKRAMMIIGQNVAAIPDQPKMTNQNIVRLGETRATVSASNKAPSAKTRVTFREKTDSWLSGMSGCRIF